MAIGFNSVDDFIVRTTGMPPITSFTLMGWFYITVDRNDFSNFLLCGGTDPGGTDHYIAQTEADGTTFNLWNGGASSVGGALPVADWFHLAITVAGTGASQFLGYVDGVLAITHAGNVGCVSGQIKIANNEAIEFLNGRAAAIKVYDAVLSQAEIAAEMPYYQPQRLTSLNAWYRLTTNTDLNDQSGNGRHFAAGGSSSLTTETGPAIEEAPPTSSLAPIMSRPLVKPRMFAPGYGR